jgi:rhodanese-related sulfurtransferase
MDMTAGKPDKANDLPAIISARDAFERSEKGELLIIDVRTPMEWMRSGVAKGALTITPQDPSFMQKLHEAVDGDMNRPIALICATGSRTAMISRFLREQGYGAVADISEGMMGNFSAPGWINSGLPLEAYQY